MVSARWPLRLLVEGSLPSHAFHPQMKIFLVICILSVEESVCRVLRWTNSTSYLNPKNWSLGRPPCSTDRIIYPGEVTFELLLPPGVQRLRELVLPSDGEILIPGNTSILLTDPRQEDPTCSGGDNYWLMSGGGYWWDPENWSGTNSASPDLERIPCPTDTVQFPDSGYFKVILPPTNVPVASVELVNSYGVMKYSEKVRQRILQEDFSMLFENGPLVITGQECREAAGCECPVQLLTTWICPDMDCPPPSCLQPVKALGDCCLKCGAFLLYNFDPVKTRLSDVERLVSTELEAQAVTWHASRTMGQIQVVLRQEDDTQDIDLIATNLNTKLLNGRLGLTRKTLKVSGPYISQSSIHSPILVFFLSFFLVIVGFFGTFYYFERNRWLWPRWLGGGSGTTFARFENLSGIVEIQSSRPSPPTRLPAHSPRGFDNPMFSEETVGFVGVDSLGDEVRSSSDSASDEESTSSEDRKTLTTLAPTGELETSLEEVPIGNLIDSP